VGEGMREEEDERESETNRLHATRSS